MTNRVADISLRKAARIAGFGLLIMFIPTAFSYFFVLEGLIVPGDAATTANNIMANELLFRIAIASFLIVIVLDVVVAWAFYVLLKPVNKSLSLLTGWFRLVYSTIFGIALLNLVNALRLLIDADYLTVFGTDQLHAQVLLSLNAFSDGWAIGYIFFSLHLFFLGYLVFKSGYIPKILGVLLIISSPAYLIDNVAILLLPNYENYEAIISLVVFVPAFIGEFSLMLWLLFKGSKIPEMGVDKESKEEKVEAKTENKPEE